MYAGSPAPAPPTRLSFGGCRTPGKVSPWPFGVCARSSTDRASDYGSEGWEFESLRARNMAGPAARAGRCLTARPMRGASCSHTGRRCSRGVADRGDLSDCITTAGSTFCSATRGDPRHRACPAGHIDRLGALWFRCIHIGGQHGRRAYQEEREYVDRSCA
jgi:hypothetical protein